MTAQRESTDVDWLNGARFESRVYYTLRNGMKINVHNSKLFRMRRIRNNT
jgi:hypothetical protein